MKPNNTPPPTDDPEANNDAGAGCMARLIAAAPDILEALERIRDYRGRFGEDDPQSIAADILDKIYSANA